MRNFILLSFFLIPFVLYSQEPVAEDRSLLWEVSGNGLEHPSYIYGTMHSMDARAHAFGDSVMAKFDQSTLLCVEVADMDISPATAMEMMLMEDYKLEDLLAEKDFKLVKKMVFEKMGLMGIFYNTAKPIMTMTMAIELHGKKDMAMIVDDHFKNEAQEKEMKIVGLETVEEAMASLDQITLREQAELLFEFFEDYDNQIAMNDTMIERYVRQDLPGLQKLYVEEGESYSGSFDKALVVDRNKKFLERMVPYFEKEKVFCAVGALHLTGETGLINSLRKMGYTVEPMYSKHTPQDQDDE